MTKTAKIDEFALYTQNKRFGPQNAEDDENNENGGCHSGKTMVYRKQGFHNPDVKTSSSVLSETVVGL